MILPCKIVEVPLAISLDLFLAFSVSDFMSVGLIWQHWSTVCTSTSLTFHLTQEAKSEVFVAESIDGGGRSIDFISNRCEASAGFTISISSPADEEDPNTGRQRQTRACDTPLGYSSARFVDTKSAEGSTFDHDILSSLAPNLSRESAEQLAGRMKLPVICELKAQKGALKNRRHRHP
ncbi:hypothetical protein PROFUN_04059 [Planoprotostelium fungivorum]|uniref:Uncharacterized protein n=1 Tax=Planoprotostelium fungivorum TaxID=1890364 RepID=A0A2P6NJD2_9EUKA|nr:hypothetical protein PROFUN_04059 [Planoprotostelium fungivorum]